MLTMIPLQESYETEFEDLRNDSREPSTAEILEWSEQWAIQLQLCGDLDYEPSMEYHLHSSSSEAIPNTCDLLQQEQDIAELRNFNFRSVQDHPHKRKEANQFVDDLLREIGISEDNIARYGEVLPYKIAQLHRVRSPRPNIRRVPVWLYKKNINAHGPGSTSKDLYCFLIEARLSLEELQQQLHQAANSRLPAHTEWEYTLLEGPHTIRSSANSGILRRLSDWRHVSRQILSPSNPYHAMIVFQVLARVSMTITFANRQQQHDMHRSYQSLPTLDECQEKGMSKISQLIEDAKRTTTKARDKSNTHMPCLTDKSVACPISNRTNPLDVRRDKQTSCTMPVPMNELETTTQSTTTAYTAQPVLKLFEPKEITDTSIHQNTTFQNIDCRNGHESLPQPDGENALSRYISVWLEHDGVVDKHLGCPQYAVLQPKHKNRKGKLRKTWYFQQDR